MFTILCILLISIAQSTKVIIPASAPKILHTFGRLPYDVSENIHKYLDPKTAFNLMVADKFTAIQMLNSRDEKVISNIKSAIVFAATDKNGAKFLTWIFKNPNLIRFSFQHEQVLLKDHGFFSLEDFEELLSDILKNIMFLKIKYQQNLEIILQYAIDIQKKSYNRIREYYPGINGIILGLATSCGRLDIVETIIATRIYQLYSCNVAIQIAITHNRIEIFKYFLSISAELDRIHVLRMVAKFGGYRIMNELLSSVPLSPFEHHELFRIAVRDRNSRASTALLVTGMKKNLAPKKVINTLFQLLSACLGEPNCIFLTILMFYELYAWSYSSNEHLNYR